MSSISGVTEFSINEQPRQLTATPTWSEASVKLGQLDQERRTIDDGLAIYRGKTNELTAEIAEVESSIVKLQRRAELLPGDAEGCRLKIASLEEKKAGLEKITPGLQYWLAQWEEKDRNFDRAEQSRLREIARLVDETGPLPQPVKTRTEAGHTVQHYPGQF